jgi:hypothetical protein
MEALPQSKKTHQAQQLGCILSFANDEDGLCDYLHASDHKSYAQELQKEYPVLSPCDFQSIYQWTSYIGENLKFEELNMDVVEIRMILFDEGRSDSFGERTIYDVDDVCGLKLQS